MSDHASTHIDVIVHFGQRSGTAEQIPLEYCYGEGIALDLSHKKPKEYITVADIEKELKKKRLRINVPLRGWWKFLALRRRKNLRNGRPILRHISLTGLE